MLSIMMIFTVACGGGNNKSEMKTTYLLDENQGVVEVVLTHDEKEVKKMDIDLTLNFKEMQQIPTEEMVNQRINSLKDGIKDYKNTTMTHEFKDNKLNVKFSIDYKDLTDEQLDKITGVVKSLFPIDLKTMKDFKSADEQLIMDKFIKK